MIPNVELPEGRSGNWSISHFEVSRNSLEAMRLAWSGRSIAPGRYTKLSRGGKVVMSDTPAEKRDHYGFVHAARGHCLINGLGIGMCLKAVLLKPEVTAVTVVEKSADVIALVAPHYADPRVTIIESCAFEYSPPKGIRYGAVWHDIWDDICADNLDDMKRLHRKYGRRADWQGSWCRWQCERAAS